MSEVKLRSFTVPPGRNFVCACPDGDGVLIAQPGDQVLIVIAETWDKAMNEAMARLTQERDRE